MLVSVSPIFYFDPRSAGQVSFPDGWTSFVFWLGYTNSSINPFIYAVKFKEFRPAFRDSLRWILCRSGTSRPDAPRWTSTNTNINFKVKYFLSTPVNILVLSKYNPCGVDVDNIVRCPMQTAKHLSRNNLSFQSGPKMIRVERRGRVIEED